MTNDWQPIDDATAWRGADLQRDRPWEFSLSDEHRAELESALASVNQTGLAFSEINPGNFPLPELAKRLQAVSAELKSGSGFSLLHGFPVDGYDYADLDKMYWGL